MEVRWNKHCSLKKNSELGDNVLVNPDHNMTWQIITKTPAQTFKGKILETFYIRKFKSMLIAKRILRLQTFSEMELLEYPKMNF